MPSGKVTERDPLEAIRRLLDGLAHGSEVSEISADVAELHPNGDTFPGEVYLGVAAEALRNMTAAGAGPIQFHGLRAHHLPEIELRGRENRKFRFAALCAAAVGGGLEPDLLDEVDWWRTDDFWRYALLATIAIIWASAECRGLTVGEVVGELSRDPV